MPCNALIKKSEGSPMQYGSAELRIKETKDKTKRAGMDISFLALVVILLAIGVTMVLSASFARAYFDPGGVTKGKATYYFIRQFIFAALGVAAMIICSRLPVGFYKRFSMPVLIAAVILLMLVPIIGTNANGAKRWIGFGAFTIQPSEIAKIGIILAFASMICARRGRMKSFRYGILPFAAILIVIVGLLVLEPHFSASIIIVAIGGVMLFLGGARLVWFIAAAVSRRRRHSGTADDVPVCFNANNDVARSVCIHLGRGVSDRSVIVFDRLRRTYGSRTGAEQAKIFVSARGA